MKLSTPALCVVFSALAAAESDKYANERGIPADEPTSMPAEWEQAHGGPATKYSASLDWLKDDITSAVKQATEAVQSHLPTAVPTLAGGVDTEDPNWAAEQGYTPLDKRDEPDDVDSPGWAEANGYLPLERRDETSEDAEEDPKVYDHAWAVENGYTPLSKRAAAEDPNSDAWAIANGYLPPSKQKVDLDPRSDEFAAANGYLPLSKRSEVPSSKTTGSALFNWIKGLGRPAHFRD